jgi:hypothetical protein
LREIWIWTQLLQKFGCVNDQAAIATAFL